MKISARRVALRLAIARAVCRFVVACLLFGAGASVDGVLTGRTAQPPFVGVVLATVLVALVLWWLRDGIDRVAARLVLGGQADGYAVMRRLTEQLAATLPVDEIAPRVAEAASRTTGRPRAEVRLWLTGSDSWVRSWPPSAESIGEGTAVEVRHTGSALGEIVVGGDQDTTNATLSSWDRRMLDTLARPAGSALSTVRLTVELRQRKAELERLTAALRASRQRLLSARATEQHRMRAEIAARVGPHLSAALAAVDRSDLTPAASCSVAAREAESALDELRTVARGVYPPTLTEVGLAASLESWLARTQVDATIDLADGIGQPLGGSAAAIAPELAACLYFCAVTSMSRLAQHHATAIHVGVSVDAGPVLSIAACVTASVSTEVITAVTDRVEAFDGTVTSELDGHEFALSATFPTRSDGAS